MKKIVLLVLVSSVLCACSSIGTRNSACSNTPFAYARDGSQLYLCVVDDGSVAWTTEGVIGEKTITPKRITDANLISEEE